MNVVYNERFGYERVYYEHGVLWKWSVVNMVCCERGLLWKWSVVKVFCCESVL